MDQENHSSSAELTKNCLEEQTDGFRLAGQSMIGAINCQLI